jgi:hypothetical protein
VCSICKIGTTWRTWLTALLQGRDPQTETNDAFAYQDLVDTGDVLGPRAFSTGPGIFWTEDLKTTEQAVKILKKYRYLYRTKMVKAYLLGNRRQRQLLAEASKIVKIMPTGEGQMDSKLGMGYAIDGYSGNEHAFSITPLYKGCRRTHGEERHLLYANVIITSGGPTAETYYESRIRRSRVDQSTPLRSREFCRSQNLSTGPGRKTVNTAFRGLPLHPQRLSRSGGKVCVGAHGQFPGLGYQWELWALCKRGMTGMEVAESRYAHVAPKRLDMDRISEVSRWKICRFIDPRQGSLVGYSQYKRDRIRHEEWRAF